ncbi:hypothetical protein NC651_021058 [Populus alba x Populus x berolinensis]|nr:hypothetical protein NC651_021058 [Populus alba x Populus x berolinensis]
MIIVEYIDEIWPQNPLLLNDPYERPLARFWVKFADDKVKSMDIKELTVEPYELENSQVRF